MNIICATIMLAGSGRIRLLQQALASYNAHTPTDPTGVRRSTELVVVVDRKEEFKVVQALAQSRSMPLGHTLIHLPTFRGKLGKLRNVAAEHVMDMCAPQFIHFVDDDVYFRKGWLFALTAPLILHGNRIGVVGGDRHPYHQPKVATGVDGVEQTDAVAGYSMLMRTSTFEELGGFPEDGNSVGASEDWSICQKAIKCGKVVGYAATRPVLHCGLTNSNGQPATGAAEILRNKPTDKDVKGVIYE